MSDLNNYPCYLAQTPTEATQTHIERMHQREVEAMANSRVYDYPPPVLGAPPFCEPAAKIDQLLKRLVEDRDYYRLCANGNTFFRQQSAEVQELLRQAADGLSAVILLAETLKTWHQSQHRNGQVK